MKEYPLDIRPAWYNPIRRLQSVACKTQGYAIVSMRIVIDEYGDPVLWTDPQMTKIEPKGDRETLLRLLTDE
jgi:hypothetical protein